MKKKRYLSKSRIVALVMLGLFVFCFLMPMLLGDTAMMLDPNNAVTACSFGVASVIVFIVSLFGPKSKEEEIANRARRTNGQTALGVLCYGVGFFFLMMAVANVSVLLVGPGADNKPLLARLVCLEIIPLAIPAGIGVFMIIEGWKFFRGLNGAPGGTEPMLEGEQEAVSNVPVYPDQDDPYAPDEEPRTPSVSAVDGMDGHEFEYFCADLLTKNGFVDVRVTPGSGDQGVDILAKRQGISYAIQCKNYASPLGNTPVQEVNAGRMFYHCHVGVVLTNSTFTSGARALAEATGVLLWDRTVLQEMIQTLPHE